MPSALGLFLRSGGPIPTSRAPQSPRGDARRFLTAQAVHEQTPQSPWGDSLRSFYLPQSGQTASHQTLQPLRTRCACGSEARCYPRWRDHPAHRRERDETLVSRLPNSVSRFGPRTRIEPCHAATLPVSLQPGCAASSLAIAPGRLRLTALPIAPERSRPLVLPIAPGRLVPSRRRLLSWCSPP